MVCPFCFHNKTDVYNSRQSKKMLGIWRRRRCLNCGKAFTTNESIDPSTVLKVLKNKKETNFSPAKLKLSLLKSMDHKNDIANTLDYIYQIIELQLYKLTSKTEQRITAQQIAQVVADTLNKHDATSYVKYLSYHNTLLDHSAIKKAFKRK